MSTGVTPMLESASDCDPCTCKRFLEDVAVEGTPDGENAVCNSLLW